MKSKITLYAFSGLLLICSIANAAESTGDLVASHLNRKVITTAPKSTFQNMLKGGLLRVPDKHGGFFNNYYLVRSTDIENRATKAIADAIFKVTGSAADNKLNISNDLSNLEAIWSQLEILKDQMQKTSPTFKAITKLLSLKNNLNGLDAINSICDILFNGPVVREHKINGESTIKIGANDEYTYAPTFKITEKMSYKTEGLSQNQNVGAIKNAFHDGKKLTDEHLAYLKKMDARVSTHAVSRGIGPRIIPAKSTVAGMVVTGIILNRSVGNHNLEQGDSSESENPYQQALKGSGNIQLQQPYGNAAN